MDNVVLYEFRFSNFNERVRWTLDALNVTYHRRPQIPGFHMKEMKKLSGQTATPVVYVDGRIITGSQTICEYFCDRASEQLLLDPERRESILDFCALVDEKGGSCLRRALFHHLLSTNPQLVADLFAIGQGAARRLLLRAIMPLMGRMLRKLDQINSETAAYGMEMAGELLDQIARQRGSSDYLFGDQLSLADITAAAMLFPLALPAHFQEVSPRARQAIEHWAEPLANHPSVHWIRALYVKDRGVTMPLVA